MMLSQKCLYALRSLVEISARSDEQVITIQDIAKVQDIPSRFLEGILSELRKSGLLESRRGKSGGYRLARPADEISIGEVIRLMNGPLQMAPAMESAGSESRVACTEAALLAVWGRAESALSKEVDGVTLADVARDCMERCSKESIDFSI